MHTPQDTSTDDMWDIPPLTDEQHEAIRKASPATNIPEERFTKSLFDIIQKKNPA